MNDWEKVKLGDVIKINELSISKKFNYKQINYYDISTVGSGYIAEDVKIIKTDDAPSRAQRLVKEGDTIISTVRPANRNFFYFKTAKENDVISTGFSVLTPLDGKIEKRFLYYLVSSQNFTDYLVANEQGATYPAVNTDILKKANVPLPNFLTQQKIATILSAYDDLIENNLKQIKLLEEMAQITYEEWFVRFKFPNYENTPVDELTGLPLGWKTDFLGNHVELIKDSVLPTDLDNSIRYIGLEHIPRKSIVLSEYGDSDNVGSLKLVVKKGDILFGKIRPYFHKVGVALDDCITSTDTIVLRAKKQELHGIILQTVFSNEFVASAVQSSNGTKMPRANWNVLKNHPIIIPEITVINQFSEISHNLIFNISNLVNQNQLLKEARDILLPRLMTGKIAV